MIVTEIGKQLAKYLADNQITQQNFAFTAHTHQTRISRIIRGDFKRITPTIREICEYAKIDLDSPEEEQNPANNAELMDAISLVWDGTDKRARALAKVIRSLKELS